MKKVFIFCFSTSFIFFGCKKNVISYDASGSFEAEEVIISSEATGTIKQFDIEEGQTLEKGQFVGYIDSIQVFLKKKQLQAQIQALLGKKPDIQTQLSSLQEQLKAAKKEQQRIANLVQAGAATTKQLDDINAQVAVLEKQIQAQKSTLALSSSGYTNETKPLYAQIDQLNDQLVGIGIARSVTNRETFAGDGTRQPRRRFLGVEDDRCMV